MQSSRSDLGIRPPESPGFVGFMTTVGGRA
jgi:hypothetical protein